MAVFESLDSERIEPEALGKEFASHELALSGKYAEEVLDGKKMVGYQFEPSSSVRAIGNFDRLVAADPRRLARDAVVYAAWRTRKASWMS